MHAANSATCLGKTTSQQKACHANWLCLWCLMCMLCRRNNLGVACCKELVKARFPKLWHLWLIGNGLSPAAAAEFAKSDWPCLKLAVFWSNPLTENELGVVRAAFGPKCRIWQF
jgi:hypothetical protein